MSLLRKSNQKQKQKPLNDLDDNDDIILDDDVTFGRNRQSKKFGKLVTEDIELSDHVKFRLWLARQLAMAKYREAQT